jgi:hypothetical protein
MVARISLMPRQVRGLNGFNPIPNSARIQTQAEEERDQEIACFNTGAGVGVIGH